MYQGLFPTIYTIQSFLYNTYLVPIHINLALICTGNEHLLLIS